MQVGRHINGAPFRNFIDRMQRGLRGRGRSLGRGERKAPSVYAAMYNECDTVVAMDDVKHLGGV